MTNDEARFNKSLRPRKPEGSLGRTAQDVHLDSHTAPELCTLMVEVLRYYLGITPLATAPPPPPSPRNTQISWMAYGPAGVAVGDKLQALVYDILTPTTVIPDYAKGLEKLSAKERVFDDAQTAGTASAVSFITDHAAYASTNKTKSSESRWNFLPFCLKSLPAPASFFFLLFFYPGADASHNYVYLGAMLLPQSYWYPNLWRALTASVDSCAEIKSAPSVA